MNNHLLLQIVAFILFSINAQFSLIYASTNDEQAISKIFETHDKENVVSYISQKRNGKITIQKNKGFLNVRGRPNLAFITEKSIIEDLKILKIDINTLKANLSSHIKSVSEKRQEELNDLTVINEPQDIERNESRQNGQGSQKEFSERIKDAIKKVQYNLEHANNDDHRRRLKKLLTRLETTYKNSISAPVHSR